MSIFTKEDMWEVAVNELFDEFIYMEDNKAIVLRNPAELQRLYKALQEAHWRAVELHKKGIK